MDLVTVLGKLQKVTRQAGITELLEFGRSSGPVLGAAW